MPDPNAVIKRVMRRKVDRPQTFDGLLGDGQGVVDVPGRTGYVYARLAGRGYPDQVMNGKVPAVHDLPVTVGKDLVTGEYKILDARFVQAASSSLPPGTIPPATYYEWFAPGGGQDPLYVQLRQFMPLRPRTTTGMTVEVNKGWIGPTDASAPILFSTTTVDLTARIPGTAGKAAFVLLTISTTGTLVATKGSEVNTASLAVANIPVVPANTARIIAAVRVYNGQTEIQEARSNTDLIDLRTSERMTLATGGGGAGFDYKIHLMDASGATVADYAATAAGLASALTASASGDVILLPPKLINLTAGITLKAGVALVGTVPPGQGYTAYCSGLGFGSAVATCITCSGSNLIQNLFLSSYYAGTSILVNVNNQAQVALRNCHIEAQSNTVGDTAKCLTGGSPWLDGVYLYAYNNTVDLMPGHDCTPIGSWFEHDLLGNWYQVVNLEHLPYFTADLAATPTNADFESLYGAASDAGAGATFIAKDTSDGSTYLVMSNGANWFFIKGTQAA